MKYITYAIYFILFYFSPLCISHVPIFKLSSVVCFSMLHIKSIPNVYVAHSNKTGWDSDSD